MTKVRNVPDELHRALEARAALLERLSVPARPPLAPSAAELVRAERDAREPT